MPRRVPDQDDLERELYYLYREWFRLKFRAARFYKLFTPWCDGYVGGVEAVRRTISKGRTAGLRFVTSVGRPDLLLENVVLDRKWKHLFNDEDRRQARGNLRNP
jgi:hypothetical protein